MLNGREDEESQGGFNSKLNPAVCLYRQQSVLFQTRIYCILGRIHGQFFSKVMTTEKRAYVSEG